MSNYHFIYLLLQFFSEDAVWTKAFASSMLVGVVTALCMTPFDTVSTRLFNQSKLEDITFFCKLFRLHYEIQTYFLDENFQHEMHLAKV